MTTCRMNVLVKEAVDSYSCKVENTTEPGKIVPQDVAF